MNNKKRPRYTEDGKKVIRVSDLYGCFYAIQLELEGQKMDNPHPIAYRGSAVHKLFRKIVEGNLQKSYAKSLTDDQIEIPYGSFNLTKNTLPTYEIRIKDLFCNHPLAQNLKRKNIHPEENIKISLVQIENYLSRLGYSLALPQEVLMKYVLSGTPDFRTKNLSLDLKSGSKLEPSHAIQLYSYKMLIEMKFRIQNLGMRVFLLGTHPDIKLLPFKGYNEQKAFPKIIKSLREIICSWENYDRCNTTQQFKDRCSIRRCSFCNYRGQEVPKCQLSKKKKGGVGIWS